MLILPDYHPDRTENASKTLNYPFLTLDFPKQNAVSCKLSNVIASSQRHSGVFVNTINGKMISLARNVLRITSRKQARAHFRYCQVQSQVQTALESHDFNMVFRSFDNGFKQLCT